MRRLTLASTLLLAACATTPPLVPAPQAPVAQPRAEERNGLGGATPQELIARFGNPALQVREGTSVKLQFRGPRCVLDAYFYPSATGALRVTHVDTRLPSGADTDQVGCISSLRIPS